jgi:hypothetical protein
MFHSNSQKIAEVGTGGIFNVFSRLRQWFTAYGSLSASGRSFNKYSQISFSPSPRLDHAGSANIVENKKELVVHAASYLMGTGVIS